MDSTSAADTVFARRLLQPLVVGLTVVGIGTSMQELPSDDPQRLGSVAARFSAAAKSAHLPRPPEELVDASQERVHEEVGPVRAGKGVRSGSAS